MNVSLFTVYTREVRDKKNKLVLVLWPRSLKSALLDDLYLERRQNILQSQMLCTMSELLC